MIKNGLFVVTIQLLTRLIDFMKRFFTMPTKLHLSPFVAASLVLGLFACHSPERTAKMIGKKATQKVTQLCLPNQVTAETCFPELEQFITPPTFSESVADKTEIMSTW